MGLPSARSSRAISLSVSGRISCVLDGMDALYRKNAPVTGAAPGGSKVETRLPPCNSLTAPGPTPHRTLTSGVFGSALTSEHRAHPQLGNFVFPARRLNSLLGQTQFPARSVREFGWK